MRDLHYSLKSFRLSKETIKILGELKEKENISWNLLFIKLIKKYGKKI